MAAVRNLPELAEEAIDRIGERTTIIFNGERVTNIRTLEEGRRIHRALQDHGIDRGAVVALCMINHPYVYSVFTGVFRSGATLVPVMFQLTPPELEYIFSHTEAKCIVTDHILVDKVREAVQNLDHIKFLVVHGGEDKPDAPIPEYSMESFLAYDEQSTLPEIPNDDVALMLYTSGTTGKPKGVMLTHANLLASTEGMMDAAELHKRDHPVISISTLPMAHIFGIGIMNYGFALPKEFKDDHMVQEAWFDAERFIAQIQEYKCTDMAGVPTMLALILSHPNVDTYDLSSLVKVDVGGAPVSKELAQTFMDRYDCRVRQLYGMTENCGLATADRISMPYQPGSAGRPYCNVEIQIVDENDNPLPPGQDGEIVTRGPCTMKGYFKQPDVTAETMRNGWLHTGDIGHFDEDGWLYVVDRKKDMIIKGGENIFPAEIENALYKHPDVAEAAVVGVPHDVYGEDIVAFVVPKGQVKLDEAELIDLVKQQVTSFKAPSRIHVTMDLPKSGIGKILRRELRTRAADLAQQPAK